MNLFLRIKSQLMDLLTLHQNNPAKKERIKNKKFSKNLFRMLSDHYCHKNDTKICSHNSCKNISVRT